ncbi:MAG: hypothetical protein ACI8UQ_001290 [Bacteroidia bacterium]
MCIFYEWEAITTLTVRMQIEKAEKSMR